MIWSGDKKIKKGIRLSEKKEDCLTRLRFADDVLLSSTSSEKLREILFEFKISAEAVCLTINTNKTKIFSNQEKDEKKEITVDNIKIEILPKEDRATEEIKNRLKTAWIAFNKYRQELISKAYRLCHRLRLFSMMITPTLTYASAT